MSSIVECVANFSEGRNPHIVQQIVDAIQQIDEIRVLAFESDADHHRSVVTFVGSKEWIVAGAFAGIHKAAQLIDMEQHRGQHPRVGAADVVPFVPVLGVTLADCAGLARALGQRVGHELAIPVYLYEAAATRPERRDLASVRRGEYEGLKQTIGIDPDRHPDYGPTAIGNAGAVIIGAREPLIAFNVYLATDDVAIAKKISRVIRHSSGGLRGVKALGLLVDGQAQVSMNLTDFRTIPIHRVVEMIRREAARYGVIIEKSELIGLIPQQAILDTASWYLQLDDLSPDQVLETRIAQDET